MKGRVVGGGGGGKVDGKVLGEQKINNHLQTFNEEGLRLSRLK